MKLNTANRSFFTLVGLALVPYVLLGVFGCGLLSVAIYRVATDGFSGLHQGGSDLRPAVAFFAVVATGTVIAALSVRRQVIATRRLSAFIAERSVPLPIEVATAGEQVGLGGRVDVLDDPHPYSFTYGLFTPRVVLSRGMADAVGADELEAVLHHEGYHVRSWDTVKVVVARAAPSAFFFLPALRHLRDRYLAGRELAADRQALRAVGRRPLAGALFRVLDEPAWADLGVAAALGGSEFLDQRVAQLEEGQEPAMPRLPRPAVWMTAAGLVVLAVTLTLTVISDGSPIGMGDSDLVAGPMGTVLAVVGGVLCIGFWLVVGLLALRSVTGHGRFG